MLKVRHQIGGLGNLMFKQAYLYAQMRRGEIPDLYLQDEKYFKQFSQEIQQMYSGNIGEPIPFVSLHIRKGDYLDKDNFYIDLTETDYYKKAVDMFPDAHFMVFYKDRQNEFRDEKDENFAYQFMSNLVGDRFVLAKSGEDETDDLNLMASCTGHIMANSSFSWWGSFLGYGETVCPKKWFTDGVMRVGLLDKWIKI